MKKLLISDACLACGSCLINPFIVENDEGKAVPKNNGIISDDEAMTITDVIEACPVSAITLENLISAEGKRTLSDIKSELEGLKQYKLTRPTAEEFECDSSILQIAEPTSGLRSGFSYTSESQAEREGLQAFNRLAYSQKHILAASALVSYKKLYLNKYTYYAHDNGCYYYVENQKIEQKLRDIAKEILEISNGSIVIPDNLLKFDYETKHFRELGLIVTQFEELNSNLALEDVEALGWYDTYVNTDEKELRTRSLYKYKLEEVVQTLCKHILSGCIRAVREAGPKAANAMIDLHQKTIDDYLPKQIDQIISLIDR